MTSISVTIPVVCVVFFVVLCVLSCIILWLRKASTNTKTADPIIFDGVNPHLYNPRRSKNLMTKKKSPDFDVSRLNKAEIADLERLLGYKIR